MADLKPQHSGGGRRQRPPPSPFSAYAEVFVCIPLGMLAALSALSSSRAGWNGTFSKVHLGLFIINISGQ